MPILECLFWWIVKQLVAAAIRSAFSIDKLSIIKYSVGGFPGKYERECGLDMWNY